MQVDTNTINSILSANTVNTSTEVKQAVKEVGNSDEKAYEVSSGEKTGSFQVDYNKISALKSDYRKGYSAFKQMVSELIQKQGSASSGILDRIFGPGADFDGVTDLGKTLASLEVDEATRTKAASLTGEDGELGVKQVSQNILNFAKAAAGGDPEKLEKMKAAFLKGFEQAEQVWGGKLPEISYKTKEAVLAGFDEMQGEKT
jgi:hypothetical protein